MASGKSGQRDDLHALCDLLDRGDIVREHDLHALQRGVTLVGAQDQLCHFDAEVDARMLGHMVIAFEDFHVPMSEIIHSLLPDRHHDRLFTLLRQLVDACLCHAQDIVVEAARKPSVACNDDEQRRAVVHTLMHKLGIEIGILRCDLRHELVGLLKERTAGLRTLLCTAELGGSDQLHRLRDLHGAFHGMDAALDVL